MLVVGNVRILSVFMVRPSPKGSNIEENRILKTCATSNMAIINVRVHLVVRVDCQIGSRYVKK